MIKKLYTKPKSIKNLSNNNNKKELGGQKF